MKARTLIQQADRIATEKGLNQSQWSRMAGHASNGQTISRIMRQGDCRVSTLLELLDAIGCALKIEEDSALKQ